MIYYVYILTNQYHTVLYIGITSNIEKRLYEHGHGLIEGFAKKYHVHKLVYYESTSNIMSALERENN